MHVLLTTPINPNYFYAVIPNLGLGYLATALRRNKHEVEILNPGVKKFRYKLIERLQETKYDFIGVKVYSHELESAKKLTDSIRKHSSDAIICVGGPHPSGDPVGTLKYLKNVDYAFSGEGEVGLPALLEILEGTFSRERASFSEALHKVSNLVWRHNEKIICNPKTYVHDLDSLGLPSWDLLSPQEYPVAPHGTFTKRSPVAPIVTTRGCPFPCTFCAAPSIMGKSLRFRSIPKVIEEIEILYRQYGIREIHIEDDNFTLNRDHAERFCEQLIKSGLDISWACPNGVRLDTLDGEILQLMERSGCYSVAVGIESDSPRILRLMKKNLKVKQIEEKISVIKKTTNIRTTGFFILGHPQETEDDIYMTMRLAKRLSIDRANFVFMKPLPGTELFGEWYKTNQDAQADFKNFLGNRVIILPKGLSKERLRKLQRKAYLSFYLRPRILWGISREITSFHQIIVLYRRFRDMFFGS